ALEVQQGARSGLLLPMVAVRDNLTPLAFARGVLDKAGLSDPKGQWTRWDCTTWLDDGAAVRLLDGALPARDASSGSVEQLRDSLLPRWAGFLGRHHLERG